MHSKTLQAPKQTANLTAALCILPFVVSSSCKGGWMGHFKHWIFSVFRSRLLVQGDVIKAKAYDRSSLHTPSSLLISCTPAWVLHGRSPQEWQCQPRHGALPLAWPRLFLLLRCPGPRWPTLPELSVAAPPMRVGWEAPQFAPIGPAVSCARAWGSPLGPLLPVGAGPHDPHGGFPPAPT